MHTPNAPKQPKPRDYVRRTFNSRDVITMANAKGIQLRGADYNKRVLYNRTNKGHIKLAAHTVANRKEHTNNKVLLRQTKDLDYIIQPQAMTKRGSMCITELYSKKQRIMLANMVRVQRARESTHVADTALLKR